MGFNVYAYLGGYIGERLLAIDWHEEKLPERGPDGRYLPRERQRTVVWPHLHLCPWRLQFWPWDREPTNATVTAMQQASQVREGARAARQQRVIVGGIDTRALDDAMALAAAEGMAEGARLQSRLAAGATVSELSLELAQTSVRAVLAASGADADTSPDAQRLLHDAARGLAGRRVGQALGRLKRDKTAISAPPAQSV